MTEFTIIQQIEAPVETVWEVLDDFGDVQRWNSGVKASVLTSDGPVGQGATRHCDFAPFGADNALWTSVEKHTQIAYPGAKLVPGLIVGGTDARFYRERGRTAYGAGLFSSSMDFATFGSRFHGHDERIDVESLELTTQLWLNVFDRLWR